MLFSTGFGKCRSTGQFFFPRHNQRGVRIHHVFLRPLVVIRRVGFAKLVNGWDNTILGEVAARTPSAVFVTVLDGKIKRGPVHAGLSSRNDFHPALPGAPVLVASFHAAKMKRSYPAHNEKVLAPIPAFANAVPSVRTGSQEPSCLGTHVRTNFASGQTMT